MNVSIPPPPPLIPSASPSTPTNTFALLLPLPQLFTPQILQILRDFYSSFGPIHVWAPVRGLGRVIIVWEREGDASGAKLGGGDWVEIGGVEISGKGDELNEKGMGERGGRTTDNVAVAVNPTGELDYFSRKKRRKNSIVLRLHPLPPTPLEPPLTADTHLLPPKLEKNYLISPPGSPPEGWEPIVEDAPNSDTLAADLIKALEGLEFGAGRRRVWSAEGDADGLEGEHREIILQTDEVTFTVQHPEPDPDADPGWAGHEEHLPTNGISGVKATVESMGGLMGGESAGWRTPGLGEGTWRIMPTGRPPIGSNEMA